MVAVSVLLAGAIWLTPNAERVATIERTLPEKPSTPAPPITERAHWDRLASMPEGQGIVKRAAKVLETPIPDCPDALYLEFSSNGNRTGYEKPYHRRAADLGVLLLAECLENKGRFLGRIATQMETIAEERSWTMPAHDSSLSNFNGTRLTIDLGSANRALVLAYAINWLEGKLPEAAVAKVRDELKRRVFDLYLAAYRDAAKDRKNGVHGNWWMFTYNNWNAVCNSCVIRAALAVIESRQVRAQFVESAERTTVPFLSGFTADGYCSEGMGYWNYGFGHHLQLGLALRQATGGEVDIFKDQKNPAVMRYGYAYALERGVSPYFADGGGNVDIVNLCLGRQVWPELADAKIANTPVLYGSYEVVALRAFGQEEGLPPAQAQKTGLPTRTFFADAQVLISRPEPDSGGKLYVAMKGGHNGEMHNHNDVGSYYLLYDGVAMSGDPGGEIYTRRTFSKDRYVSKMLNSYGHPVPVLGGELQETGRKAAAKVVQSDFTDARDVYVIDFGAAYGKSAPEKLVRTFVYDRTGPRFKVTDEVRFSTPKSFSVPLVTYGKLSKTADPDVFTLVRNQRKLTVRVQADAPWEFSEETIENPGRPSVTRYAFTFTGAVEKGSLTLVYEEDK
jgi:hypothetical protein